MGKITTIQELKQSILELENKQTQQWENLKEDVIILVDDFKTINLIKNTIGEVFTSKELIQELVISSAGLIFGLLSKKYVPGKTSNIVRNIIEKLMQGVVMSLLAGNQKSIKLFISRIFDNLLYKKDVKTSN
jgi:hypothetical protein